MKKHSIPEIALEESLSDAVAYKENLREIPLTRKIFWLVGWGIALIGGVVLVRFSVIASGFEAYSEKAVWNLSENKEIAPPRGLIYDRTGKILAENTPTFFLLLNESNFKSASPDSQKSLLQSLGKILELSLEDLGSNIEKEADSTKDKIILADNLDQKQLIELKSLSSNLIEIQSGFRRLYSAGSSFSSLLGYTGFATKEDIAKNENISAQALVGKSGLEKFYDSELRGESGTLTNFRNARGETLETPMIKEPVIGQSLHLTIDAEFQQYFFERFKEGLKVLGRSTGVGIAMNPKTGEILALLNFPVFDNNLFVNSGHNEEKRNLLTSSLKPLFDRAVSGFYNPGSTIKPLVGVAVLKEGLIKSEREIFSPGFLDVPNPYDPDKPTRYLDWRYQGSVNLAAAIAQSSNVYFYTVGGGFGDIKGLGISRLNSWWRKFGLGKATGIDLPGEADGFLPTAQAKETKTKRPWLLGDTFNVSIGQGDLLVTPLQILNYITAIANTGKMYKPYVRRSEDKPQLLNDLSDLTPEIQEVQKGMRRAVTAELGTAHLLDTLPFAIGAKTGSAQIQNNTQENAFFVGYAPFDDPQIAILVLIEQSREGSLNTLPIARDVLGWYYEHRLQK